MGELDFIRNPERGVAWGGPFNGQTERRAIFDALIKALKPSAIVETGTYLGTTTEYLADTGLPVYSVESHVRNYGFARARLRKRRNVHLLHKDSRLGLKIIFKRNASFRTEPVLLYLDAHWNDDLPLAEELEIIFSTNTKSIVIVDDFEVPGDPAYNFDDFGNGKTLNEEYITSPVRKFGLSAFYPALAGNEETGMRTGCVILVSRELSKIVSAMPGLKASRRYGIVG